MPQASGPELGRTDYFRSSSSLSTLTLRFCLSEGKVSIHLRGPKPFIGLSVKVLQLHCVHLHHLK